MANKFLVPLKKTEKEITALLDEMVSMETVLWILFKILRAMKSGSEMPRKI